jgi:hypothetical protein
LTASEASDELPVDIIRAALNAAPLTKAASSLQEKKASVLKKKKKQHMYSSLRLSLYPSLI